MSRSRRVENFSPLARALGSSSRRTITTVLLILTTLTPVVQAREDKTKYETSRFSPLRGVGIGMLVGNLAFYVLLLRNANARRQRLQQDQKRARDINTTFDTHGSSSSPELENLDATEDPALVVYESDPETIEIGLDEDAMDRNAEQPEAWFPFADIVNWFYVTESAPDDELAAETSLHGDEQPADRPNAYHNFVAFLRETDSTFML